MGVLCLFLVLLCSTVCPSSFVIILMGKRELVALRYICLKSSVCLVIVSIMWLFLGVPRVSLHFVIVYFLIILACFLNVASA